MTLFYFLQWILRPGEKFIQGNVIVCLSVFIIAQHTAAINWLTVKTSTLLNLKNMKIFINRQLFSVELKRCFILRLKWCFKESLDTVLDLWFAIKLILKKKHFSCEMFLTKQSNHLCLFIALLLLLLMLQSHVGRCYFFCFWFIGSTIFLYLCGFI